MKVRNGGTLELMQVRQLLRLAQSVDYTHPVDDYGNNSEHHGHSGASVSQRDEPVAAYANCKGCDIVMDLRCAGIRAGRHAFFHRIVNCLLPFYGLIEQVRWEPGRRCAVTWFTYHRHADPNLLPFIELLAPDAELKFIDENAECSSNLYLTTVEPSYKQGFNKRFVEEFANDDHVAATYKIDLQSNARVLQRDSLKYQSQLGLGGTPTGVLLLRKSGTSPAGEPVRTTREFDTFSENALREGLNAVLPRPLVNYYGSESVADTIRMFVLANLIAGYHGAGIANAMFTSRPACVLEVSTFKDLKSKKPWRTNADLIKVSPNLAEWETYKLPLKQLLDANHLSWQSLASPSTDAVDVVDESIKDLPLVSLTSGDVEHMAGWVSRCLERVEEAAKTPPPPSSGTRQVAKKRHLHKTPEPTPMPIPAPSPAPTLRPTIAPTQAPVRAKEPPEVLQPEERGTDDGYERDGVFKVNPKDKHGFDFS